MYFHPLARPVAMRTRHPLRLLGFAARVPPRRAALLTTSSTFNPYLADAHPLTDLHLEPAQITQYGPNGHYIWHRDGTPR